jgi:hypothetical protein
MHETPEKYAGLPINTSQRGECMLINLSRCALVVSSVAAIAFSQAVKDPNNLITDGGFNTDKPDIIYMVNHGAAGGPGKVVDGEFVCPVIPTGNIYDNQITRNDIKYENGVTYFMSFDAKADIARPFEFCADHYGHDDGGQYPHYSDDPVTGAKANLTTTMQTFTRTFTMTAATDTKGRFILSIGATASTVTVDNFILIDKSKITAIRPQIVSPTEARNAVRIVADARGIAFRFTDVTHCGYQIYSLSGKLVAGSGSINQGSDAHYRVDYRSMGIAAGKYVAQALDGNQRYSTIVSVMP